MYNTCHVVRLAKGSVPVILQYFSPNGQGLLDCWPRLKGFCSGSKVQFMLQRHGTTCCGPDVVDFLADLSRTFRDVADLSPTSSQRRRQVRDFLVTSSYNFLASVQRLVNVPIWLVDACSVASCRVVEDNSHYSDTRLVTNLSSSRDHLNMSFIRDKLARCS